MDEDEVQDEKQRLQHENDTRNYKLWSRGATFDYIRYGVVEDKKERPLVSKVLHIKNNFKKYQNRYGVAEDKDDRPA